MSFLTCKTYCLKAFINFFCLHAIFWHRTSLIRSLRTECFFSLRQTFQSSYWFSTKYLYFEPHCNIFAFFLCVCFRIFPFLLNICALLCTCCYLPFFVDHQYCGRAHISSYRWTIRDSSFCVYKFCIIFHKSDILKKSFHSHNEEFERKETFSSITCFQKIVFFILQKLRFLEINFSGGKTSCRD